MPESPRLKPIIPVAHFPTPAPHTNPAVASSATQGSGEASSMNRNAGRLAAKTLHERYALGRKDIPPAEQLAEQIGKIYKEIKRIGPLTPRAYGADKPLMVEDDELRHSELFQAWMELDEELKRAENEAAGKAGSSNEELRKKLDSQTQEYNEMCRKNAESKEELLQEKTSLVTRPVTSWETSYEAFQHLSKKLKQRLTRTEGEARELLALIEALPEIPVSSEKIEYIKQLRAALREILADRGWTYSVITMLLSNFQADFVLLLGEIEKMKKGGVSESDVVSKIVQLKKIVMTKLPHEIQEMWRGMITVWDAIRLIAEDEGNFEKNTDGLETMICDAICTLSNIKAIIDYVGLRDQARTTQKTVCSPLVLDKEKDGGRTSFLSPEERKEIISRAELSVLAKIDYENLSWSSRFLQEFVNIKNWEVSVRNGAIGIFDFQGKDNTLGSQETRELLVKLAPKLEEAADNFDILNADLADTLAWYEQESDESGKPEAARSLTREQGEQLLADLTLRAASLREIAFNYQVYVRCLESAASMESEQRIEIEEEKIVPAESAVFQQEGDEQEAVDEAPPVTSASSATQKSREEIIKELDALLESAQKNVEVAAIQLEQHLTDQAITPYGHVLSLRAAISAHIAAAADYANAQKIQRQFNLSDKPDPEKLKQDELHSRSEAVLLNVYAQHPLSAFGPVNYETLMVLEKEKGVRVIRSMSDYFRNLGTKDNPDWVVENLLELSATMRSPRLVKASKTITRLKGFHGHVKDGLKEGDLKSINADQITYLLDKDGKEMPGTHTKLLSQLRVGNKTWKAWRQQALAQGKEVKADVKLGLIPRSYGASIIRRGAASEPQEIDLGSFTPEF